MLTRSKPLLTVLAAAAMMLTLVANASARSLSVTEKEWEVLFRELEFNAGGNRVICPLTLLGHFFERTIPKGGQVSVIRHVEPTNGAAPPCTGGTMTVLAETLPWRINYVSFTGALPEIQAIRLSLIGVALRVSTGSLECLAGTTALKPAFAEVLIGRERPGSGKLEAFRADETVGIPLGGGFLCELAGESRLHGTGTILNLPRNAQITIALI